MNSSGIKRGLAGSAITALAISGLPFLATSSSAAPATDFDGGPVRFLSQAQGGDFANDASVKFDGQNRTIRLEAQTNSATSPVVFQYNNDANADINDNDDVEWVTIATVTPNDDGFASYEWDAAGLVGADVALRARVVRTDGGTSTTSNDGRQGVDILGGGSDAESVNITTGSQKGVFQEPYSENNDGDTTVNDRNIIVEGTTSATEGDVNLYWVDQDGSRQGETNPVLPPEQGPAGAQLRAPVEAGPSDATGTFAGVVNIDGYDFSGNPDQIAVGAELDTDDVEGFTLYNQTIASITADPTSANSAGDETQEITLTVVDQNGAPIAGAEVRSSAAGNRVVGYTDANGEVVADQAGGTNVFYYANATDSNPFEAGLGDKRTENVEVGQYNPESDSLTASSDNGSAFDFDEYDADDIQVQVQDQNGAPFETDQTVEYYWSVVPFDADQDEVRVPAQGEPNSEQKAVLGEATIPLPFVADESVTDTNVRVPGTYTLFAGLQDDPNSGQGGVELSEVLEVKAGQAEIVFDEESEQAQAGSSEEISGSLALEDGTGLPGRDISLTYKGDDVDGDAAFAQEDGDDQAVRIVTTDSDGNFSATLNDPAEEEGQSTETGTVLAQTIPTPEQNNDENDTALEEDQSDEANAEETTTVTFFNENAPEGATVEVLGLDGDEEQTPGVAKNGSVLVEDADGNALSGVAVTLTVDGDSFFTTGDDEDSTPADGDDQGDLASLGQEIVVITGTDGMAKFKVAIEGSDEFDNDGTAEDTVTATISTDSDSDEIDYDTKEPLNGGEVVVELAADRFQDSGVLPLLPTTDDAAYDVQVTDQFGNPVGDVDFSVDIDGVGTVIDGDEDSSENSDFTTDFDNNAEFFVTSDVAGDSTPVVTWDNAPVMESGVEEDQRDIEGEGPTVEFYEVDFANGSYNLAQQGAETQPVGSTVIMTYTATDQNGEPIEFKVDFFRTGPDNQQGGEANSQDVPTGEDGKASYVFAGTAEGTATVTAIGSVNGEVVPESQATDTVSFGKEDETPENPNNPDEPIIINISGDDNGGSKDVVRALVTNGEAETIKLFKIRGKVKDGNRRLKQVREDVVPEGGNLTFKVADRNGNKKTRFIAKVSRDAQDGPENFKSNTQKIR